MEPSKVHALPLTATADLVRQLQSPFFAWQYAKPMLEQSVEMLHGTHTIDDICLMIGSGSLRLWVSPGACALTEFFQTPRIKVLNVFLVGGDLGVLRLMYDEQLEPFARQNGCARITGAGRPGWSRVPSNWVHGGVYMHKDL